MNINNTRIHLLAREGAWVVIGNIISVAGSLALIRVLTEFLDPSQYGKLALALTMAGLVNQVVMGGVANGIIRFYSIAAEKQDLSGYLRASWRLMCGATLVTVAIALILLTCLLVLRYSQWLTVTASAVVFSIMSSYNNALSGIQNAARQRAIVAFHSGLDAWLKILLAVGVIHWLGISSTSVLIGYALSSLFVTGSQFIFLHRLILNRNQSSSSGVTWTRKMWDYSWPFSAWGTFTWLQQSSDRWSLEAFSNTQDVGLYAVLFQVGYAPISIVATMLVSFIGPILFERSGDATDASRNLYVHKMIWRITFFGLFFALMSFLLSWALHDWLFRLFVSKQFYVVSYLLPWMVLAGGFFAIGQILVLKLASEMRSAAMIKAKIVTAVLGIFFCLYGAHSAGLKGIVAAVVAFSTIYLLWMLQLSIKLTSTVVK